MNKEEYIASLNLEINDNIARLTSKVDDEICEVWKINKKDVLELLNFQENLIKYIEDKIEECENTIEVLSGTNSGRISILRAKIHSYQDLLERIKNNNYEK